MRRSRRKQEPPQVITALQCARDRVEELADLPPHSFQKRATEAGHKASGCPPLGLAFSSALSYDETPSTGGNRGYPSEWGWQGRELLLVQPPATIDAIKLVDSSDAGSSLPEVSRRKLPRLVLCRLQQSEGRPASQRMARLHGCEPELVDALALAACSSLPCEAKPGDDGLFA